MKLSGKNAIITGSSRGIGAETAKSLAAGGATVWVNYSKSADAAQQVVDEINSNNGKAHLVQADMSSPNGVKQLFQHFDENAQGKLNILVNNAGFFPYGSLIDSTDEDFEKVINLNVRGVFQTAREAAKRMEQGGRIINIGSIFGERMPLPNLGLYTMSKFAVSGFTRAWARDLGPQGITVNCVQPGPIDTELNPADGEFAPYIKPHVATGRYGTVKEVASLITYLASDEASYVNGACINIDGGVNA